MQNAAARDRIIAFVHLQRSHTRVAPCVLGKYIYLCEICDWYWEMYTLWIKQGDPKLEDQPKRRPVNFIFNSNKALCVST